MVSALFPREAFSFQAGLDEVRAAALGAQFLAAGFDAEGLLDGAESKPTGDALVEDLQVVVFELDDPPTIDANEVIVGRFVEKVRVVGGLAVAEVDFLEESGLGEEGEGAIEGGAGGPGIGSVEPLPEFVRREVLVRGEDGIDDGVSLGSVAEPLHPDEGVELLPDLRCHWGEYGI